MYFCGYGFEERSITLLSLISGKTHFDHSYCMGFPSTFLAQTLRWRQNKLFIDDTLSSATKNHTVIDISVKQPLQIRQTLREKINKQKLSIKNSTIFIDITSFPKSSLFMLLKELVENRAHGYLFYVEPVDYELPISQGVKDVRTLPFFGNDYDPKKQKLLIEILGFEGLRSYAIWETFDPHKTIALICREESLTAETENQLLLSRPNVEKDFISFYNLKQASVSLEALYKKYGKNYNIMVSTLGTKITAVSLFYFANQHKNVFVTFSRPAFHNEHYSIGAKRLHIAEFNPYKAALLESISL